MYRKEDPTTSPLLYEATMEELVNEIRRRSNSSVVIYEQDDGIKGTGTASTLVWWYGGWNACMGLVKHGELWLIADKNKGGKVGEDKDE